MGGEVPIPLSVKEVPSSVKDLIGMSRRVVHPNEVVTGEYNAKRINIQYRREFSDNRYQGWVSLVVVNLLYEIRAS
jgi:hypothetical protein